VGSPRQVLIVDEQILMRFELQPGDLRENILLRDGLESFSSGQGLQIGAALIRLTFRCEPCAYLNTLQPGLMQRLSQYRGWLGMVITGGTIAIGDTAQHSLWRFPPLADDAKSRFFEFVATIPSGNVVTTKDVILALGVTRAYYRVLPAFMKQAPKPLPVHRIVAIDGSLLRKHLPTQATLLMAEGVSIQGDRVCPSHYWPASHFNQAQGVLITNSF
jgi:alkylated DNA nucleotide flippase Atl1